MCSRLIYIGLIVAVIALLGNLAVCVDTVNNPQTNNLQKCQGSHPNECNGKCVNLQNDEQNCGDCGNVCSNGEVCQKGRCINSNNNRGISNNNNGININKKATCTDGIKNGDETGIDCGGSCQPCNQQVSGPNRTIVNTGGILAPPGQITTGTQMPDLTGVWGCDDGGHYYIRQIGNTIWWYGENDASSPSFSNVFYGTIMEYSPSYVITGNWADVPKGKYASSSGTLRLNVETNNKLATVQQTGNFGGTSWVRPI